MTAADLYAVLGVSRGATVTELADAYRRRVRLTHPDAGGDAIAFRAVQRAYEILSDPGLRAGYDAGLDGDTHVSASQARAAPTGESESAQPDPAAQEQHQGRAHRPEARSPSSLGRQIVDLGQIRWAARFVATGEDLKDDHHLSRRVKIVPGRWWWAAQASLWVLLVVWCFSGLWIGPTLASGLWLVGWELVVVLVAVQVVRARWSVFIVVAVCLAWPAYTRLDLIWSWVTFAWLAGAAILPLLRAATVRPVWPMGLLRAGNVFGEPRWGGADTAAIALQLTVIPAAQILHRVGPAEHAIVLDRKVALIGAPEDVQAVAGYSAKAWPHAIISDPQRAVDGIGSWLLTDTDGWTINRWALAAVANRQERLSRP